MATRGQMPEASNSNSHGYDHGITGNHFYNTGGVEEIQINRYSSSTHSGVDKVIVHNTPDVTGDIGLPGLRPDPGDNRGCWTIRTPV